MKIITDPIELLKELDAYLSLKSISDYPIPIEDVRDLRDSVDYCLLVNGINTGPSPERPAAFIAQLKPWERPNEHNEWPGWICCKRAGGRCYEHSPRNYITE